jgi:hypothetical protein
VKEISQITGLSYSTVGRGLEKIGAERVAFSWPIEWMIKEGSVPSEPEALPLIGPAHDGRVAVGVKHVDNLVSTWNEKVASMGAIIASLKITPESDPKDLVGHFTSAASTFANLAYTLGGVASKPDWFELAGGNLEDFQVN